jgi:hypothetical protein
MDRPFLFARNGAPAREVIWCAPGKAFAMRFAISSGTEPQSVEWCDSADLALEAVSSLLAQGRPDVKILDEHGQRVSLADLRALAEFQNDSDDA